MTMSFQDRSQRQVAGSPEQRRVMVSVAPNGGRKTKADHQALPLSARELAQCAAECCAAGASLIHVHVRDELGEHSLDVDAYRDVIAAIRKEIGQNLVVQITTESLGKYVPAQMIETVRSLRPEAASIALREIVRSEEDEKPFADLLAWMAREAVTPQIILYDQKDQEILRRMQDRGLVAGTLPVLYVLGRYTAGQTSEPADLLPFLDRRDVPHWSVCAFGRYEAACVIAAALLGGNARVGFENNLRLPTGELARSNAETVSVVADALKAMNIPLETADSLRETFSKLR